jgi:mRNA degradation ribonuclease J1/J2
LIVFDPDKDKVKLGNFEIEWVRVSHSIPDAVAIVVKTPVGRVIYTGDFHLISRRLMEERPISRNYRNLERRRRCSII